MHKGYFMGNCSSGLRARSKHISDNNYYTPQSEVIQEEGGVIRHQVKGAVDTSATDTSGKTPLHYAASWGELDVVKFLMDKGADVNATDMRGKTPLHYFFEEEGLSVFQRWEIIVKSLANDGTPIVYEFHPLHYAAAEGRKDVVEWHESDTEQVSGLGAGAGATEDSVLTGDIFVECG